MNIPHNALILVVDGSTMLFLRNQGQGGNLDLVSEAQHQRDDQDGSAPTSGRGGASVHEGDYQQLDENRYAADAADQLRMRALAGDFEALVIIAPPKTLGELRKHLHKEVESLIVMELPKEMTNRPLPDIAAMLTGRSDVAD